MIGLSVSRLTELEKMTNRSDGLALLSFACVVPSGLLPGRGCASISGERGFQLTIDSLNRTVEMDVQENYLDEYARQR
jgi:hypothetical protein